MKGSLKAAFCVMGFLGVAFGAFGAHALRGRVTPADLENWKTATLYLFVHTLAGIVSLSTTERKVVPSFFLAGCVIFPFSLYALVLSGVRELGAVTPVGGVCFLVGWLLLAREAIRKVPS
jgi:uncharacterized membrane protein YgdD (TMEM256/DUF423 family)